jgi:phosphatidylglycerophosphatase C
VSDRTAQPEQPDDRRKVAAFDFDGTISERDSLGPFLKIVCGRVPLYRELALRSPVLAAAAVGLGDRDAEKERLVGRLLAGRAAEPVREAGVKYAQQLASGDALRPEMLEKLDWHRSRGHEIVIVSASLDVYLEPIAPLLGVDHVLCTKLGVGPDDRLTGLLEGGNVRGPEKIRRVQEWLGSSAVELWAYGDSAGDRELLAAADHPVWMHGKAR